MFAPLVGFGQCRIIAAAGAKISNTGNTNENTLVSVTIPGGLLGPNGFLRCLVLFSASLNTNTKTLKAKLGGTTFMNLPHVTATQQTSQAACIIQNRNSQASQIGNAAASSGMQIQLNAAVVTASIDMTQDQTLTITAQCNTSGSDTLDLERYIIESAYAA